MDLLRPLYPKAERFAVTLAPSRDDAKDLLQDAIIILWRKFEDLRDPNAFKSYLFTVLLNRNRQEFKKRSRHVPFQDGAQDLIPAMQLPLDVQADSAFVRAAVNALPIKIREAVILYEVNDIPIAEIAAMQKCSISAVKVRLMRARRTLARKLGVTPTPTTPLGITLRTTGE